MTDLIAPLGGTPEGERLARIERSPNWRDGAFQNPVPTSVSTAGKMGELLKRQLFGREERVPKRAIPIVTNDHTRFDAPPASGLRITWLGHSSTLIEIDGYRVLVDPLYGERVSPSPLVGPKRFHAPALPLAELPALDVVLITHDHYDHLDYPAVRGILKSERQKNVQWVTTLGVGAHLEQWGVAPAKITELDWGDAAHVGDLKLTAHPARHFSGRVIKRNQTLWASWVVASGAHRVLHSGDTGWFDGLAGLKAHGPYDLALIKSASYDVLWPDIHLNPEEAVRMNVAIGNPLMLPLHWGTFNLAFHDWFEPPERVLAEAARTGTRVVIPRIGAPFEPATPPAFDPWWREEKQSA
ncbi:MAG: MBL fold metallo-hydrolase [Gemmatimonadaceae bacterium]